MLANTSNVIKLARAVNMTVQAENQRAKEQLGPLFFAKAFKTIKIDLGRRAGHTSAIINLARFGDVVIVNNSFTAKEIAGEVNGVLVTCDPSYWTHLLGKKADCIWVDASTTISKERIEEIYTMALRFDANQIIMLG